MPDPLTLFRLTTPTQEAARQAERFYEEWTWWHLAILVGIVLATWLVAELTDRRK